MIHPGCDTLCRIAEYIGRTDRSPEPRSTAMPAEQRKDLIRRMLSPSTSLTSRVIEQRLGAAGHAVTRRTLERDLQELLDAGEAVASDGKPRGFRRGAIDAFRLRRELDPAEAVLFRLAEAHLRQLLPSGFEENFGALFREARETTTHGGPAAHAGRSAMARWAAKVRAIPDALPRIPPRVRPAVHAAVSDALLRERMLHVRYWARYRDELSERQVSPLALIQMGVCTYLAAASARSGHVFTMALHRIRHAEVSEAPAHPPPGFDLDDWMASPERQFGSRGDIDLVLRVSSSMADLLEESPLSRDQRLTHRTDGWAHLEARLPWTPPLVKWILAGGESVEVLAPVELRQWVGQRVLAAAAMYGDRAEVARHSTGARG